MQAINAQFEQVTSHMQGMKKTKREGSVMKGGVGWQEKPAARGVRRLLEAHEQVKYRILHIIRRLLEAHVEVLHGVGHCVSFYNLRSQ